MKKIIQLLTALAVLVMMSISGAVVANAAPASDAYKRVSDYLGSEPAQNAILSQGAQSWAESLAQMDKGTVGKTNPAFSSNPRPDYTTTLTQVLGSGANAVHAVDGARNGSDGAKMVNTTYNTVGIGTALGKSGQTYVVITYARVETPPPAPKPAPKPAPAPVVVQPAPAPVVVPEPAPVVIPEPAPVEQPQPKPVAESPKPAPKATATPKPTTSASSSPKPTQSPTAPAITKEELAKEKAINEAEKAKRIAESERASKAELEAQETKAWQKQTVTKAGIGFGGVGALAFLLLPFTRQRKTDLDDEQFEPTVTLDDDDDDWNIGS